MAKKREVSLVRSSAAEYLTFVAASGGSGVQAVYAEENVWLTQKMMGELYGVETHTVNYHLKKVFADSELEAPARPTTPSTTACPPSSPWATRSTPSVRCNSASGQPASSSRSPSRASRWTTSA